MCPTVTILESERHLTETSPITKDDIAFVVEQVVSHVGDRWIEKGILGAPDDETATKVAKTRCGQGGFCFDGYYVDWLHGRITVDASERSGVLSFRDLVRYVRHGIPKGANAQLTLFPT